MPRLLNRESFAETVLTRDGLRCVVCREPADAAHHLIDRGLWEDGGYYVEDGVALCEGCHVAAEKTLISADELRAAAGIKTVLLPEVWRALLRAAKRADVSLRMELMNPMDYTYFGGRQRRQRLEFLAAFLDDETVRDTKSDKTLYDGPSAGFEFKRLEVCDFAATGIAGILKMREEPAEEWTPKQWAQFRKKVKAALTHEQ